MKQDHEQQLAFSFFRQHPLVTLSTLSRDNVPQTAAIYTYTDNDMNCFFATRPTTRKFANLTKNNTAVLSAYDENLLMFGEIVATAQLMEDGKEIAELLPKLHDVFADRESAHWIPPVAQLPGSDYVFFKLEPKEVTFINYEQSTSENPQPLHVHFKMQ